MHQRPGAVDFIEKPFDDEVLLAAIGVALGRYERAGHSEADGVQVRAKLASLPCREHEVLRGLLAGQANKAIAYDLQISARTVEVHRANVMTKMGAGSLSALVRMALVAEALPNG